MRNLADSLPPQPAVEFLRPAVPEGDDVIQVAHKDRVVGGFKKVGLFAQNRARRLTPEGEECGDGDGSDTDQAADESRAVGLAVLHHIAQDGQCNAGEANDKNARPLKEPPRHQNDHDVEHGDRDAERRERVYDENRDREQNGRKRQKGRPGLAGKESAVLHDPVISAICHLPSLVGCSVFRAI